MRNQNAEPSSTLLVKGVPHDCTEEDLRNAFEAWTNDVTSCRVIKDKSTNQARGFAFVEMGDETIESKAIDSLQGAELMGRPLRINKAEPRGGGPRRGGRGGYDGGSGRRRRRRQEQQREDVGR